VKRKADAREPLLTRRFVIVVTSGIFYFMALGALLPVVPRYVDKRLGGDDIAVGVAVGALAVGAILLRPLAGRLGDRWSVARSWSRSPPRVRASSSRWRG
jgi:MFS family permease